MYKRWWPVSVLVCALLLAMSSPVATADSAFEVTQKARSRSYEVPTPRPEPMLGPQTPGGDDDMPNRGGTVTGPKVPQSAGVSGNAKSAVALWLDRVEGTRAYWIQLLRHVK